MRNQWTASKGTSRHPRPPRQGSRARVVPRFFREPPQLVGAACIAEHHVMTRVREQNGTAFTAWDSTGNRHFGRTPYWDAEL
jgi:hypothetical protein